MISNAATGLGNVVGLVFVAAFAPDEGERLGEVTAGSRDSVLGTAQVALQYPTPDGAGTATEFAIDPAKLHDVFAADLPAQQAAVMAATQRPVSELAFTEPSGPPAWIARPDGARVPRQGGRTEVVRSMAERARCHHHRGRGLARDHDLPARRRRRRDQDRGGARFGDPTCGLGAGSNGTSPRERLMIETDGRRAPAPLPRERRYLRSDLNAARSSSQKIWGCSQAAKWPPRSTRL